MVLEIFTTTTHVEIEGVKLELPDGIRIFVVIARSVENVSDRLILMPITMMLLVILWILCKIFELLFHGLCKFVPYLLLRVMIKTHIIYGLKQRHSQRT